MAAPDAFIPASGAAITSPKDFEAALLGSGYAKLPALLSLSLPGILCIVAAWILGGFWYVNYYYAEKAVILKGPWPWAHNIFMETKEHLFFIPLILALYLPIAAAQKLAANRTARAMVMVVAMFVVLNGLAIEGAGAIINYGAKVAFIHSGAKGSE